MRSSVSLGLMALLGACGGTISILQHRYELGPDFEVLDEFQYSRPEVGVFIATAD